MAAQQRLRWAEGCCHARISGGSLTSPLPPDLAEVVALLVRVPPALCPAKAPPPPPGSALS
jgi:hypothetical protein